MSIENKQKGFGIVEGLLAVIALTLIVGIGFYVVNVNKDKKEDKRTAQSNTQAETKPAEQKKEYIEFKDLGFKIEKSDKMTDWTYLDDPQLPMTKYVQSAAHVKDIDTCNEGAQYPPLGSPSEKSFAAFSKIDGMYKESDEMPGNNLVKQFDTFYISIGYPNGGSPCFNEKGVGYPIDRSPPGAQETLLEALKNAEKL